MIEQVTVARFDALTVVLTKHSSFWGCDTLSDSSGLLDLWRWGYHSLLKCWEPLNQQHNVTFQKIWSLTELLKEFPFMVYCNETKVVSYMHACTAYLRHVGAPSRLIFRHSSNWFSLNFLGLTRGWQTFLRAHAPTVDNFWWNPFAFRKSEFTSAIFPIISMTS